jgi:hypothetical protein
VERANGMILDALKKRLYQKEEKHPGRWLKELPAVVWGLRTQASRSTDVSPYFMVYGSVAILLADIAFRAPRVENYDEDQAAAVRTEDIDRAEEERLITCVRTSKYLEGLWRYYNRNVKGRSFTIGDLVLRRKQKTEGLHKLSSPGGPLRRKRCYSTRVLSLMRLRWTRCSQLLAHRAPYMFLPLK